MTKFLDFLVMFGWVVCKTLQTMAEVFGYWFITLFVYYLALHELPKTVGVWALVGAFVLYLGTRVLASRLDY